MADSPLIDIFDLCVERMAAGETVEDCLRDYPDYADELRGLLEMGSLVFQAQAHTNDEEQAQAHTRMRIEEALQTDFAPRKGHPNMHDADSTPEKEKNTPRPLRRTVFWMGSAAAAVFAFAFGFAFATTPIPAAPPQAVAFQATSYSFREKEFELTATQYVLEVTQTAAMQSIASSTPGAPVTIDVNDAKNEFILTATQYVAEITQTAEVKFTQTAVMMGIGTTATPAPALSLPTEVALVLNTPLPAPTMAPADVSGAAHGDTAITGAVVSTSVAGYVAMTPTMAALEPIVAGEKDTTTSSVAPIPLEPAVVNEVPMGADGYTSDGRTVSGSGALAVTSGGGGPSTDLLALSTPLSYGDESTGLAALPNVQQQALQPLKAGEIDDNAEWDTYTEFRRNYLSTYGSTSIIDFDVTGRRIIKVVDAEGKPILGARVEVSMDKVIVSTSRTYATGLTLFFPNADPRTQRRDEFKVAVTVGQYQAFKTLDLRKLGDVIEIQMPIVIVRDANQQNGLPTVPPPPEVPTVFIGIPENLPTVPPPMMEATMPIVTYTPTPMLPTFTPTPFVR